MDFQSDDHFDEQYRSPMQSRDAMMTTATVLSVIAIATTCCIYASMVCGSLSIILALLARGRQQRLSPQGKLAVTTSVAAIVISILATVIMFAITIREYGSLESFMKSYSDMVEAMTGMPL